MGRKKREAANEYWAHYWMSSEEREQELEKKRALEEMERAKEAERLKEEEKKTVPEEKKITLDDIPTSQLNTSQRIWVFSKAFILASLPFLLYMFMPAIILSIGGVVFHSFANYTTEGYTQQVMNFYTFVGIVAVLLFLFRNAKKRGKKVLEEISLSFENINWKYIGLMVGFGFTVSVVISSLYTMIPDSWMAGYDEMSNAAFRSYDVILALVSLIILDPIAEEIVFRGYMMNRLLPRYGEKATIWIVTIVFALCHISPLWIVYGLAFGLVLAKISIRHDNILYSIALHIGFNLPTLPNYLIQQNDTLNNVIYANKFLILIYGIISASVAWFIFKYYKKLENL